MAFRGAQAPHHHGGEDPERDQGRRHGPCRGLERRDERSRRQSEHDAPAQVSVERAKVQIDAVAGLGRRHPLQEVPLRDVEPDQRARHRVGHVAGLVRQRRDPQQHLQPRQPQVAGRRPQVAPLRDAHAPRNQPVEHRHERWDEKRAQHETGPEEGRHGGERPRGHREHEQRRRGEGPAQVVEHLPPAVRQEARPPPPALLVPCMTEDPRQELPIAPGPPVVAADRDLVVGRELLEQIDVGHEAGAGVEALEEVVAQERVVRHPAGEGRLEGVHVVDALPRVRPLAEEILVDVGHGGRIRVHAARARDDALVGGAAGPGGKRRRDPRLQDTVAVHDPPGVRVEPRPVQRVRHGADEPVRGGSRQPRVGVERDHVAHARRRVRRNAADRDEGRVRGAAQEPVQLVEFASLPLPSDPPSLGRVPHAAPMEQQEAVPSPRHLAVTLVEAGDAVGEGLQQLIVVGHVLLRRILPVGQQGEVEVAPGVGEVVHLQLLH